MPLADRIRRSFSYGALGLLVLLLLHPRAILADGSTSKSDLAVAAGESRMGDLSVLGKTVRIDGRLNGSLVAVQSSVYVNGVVTGDVILLGGEIHFGREGRVERDLLLLASQAYPEVLRQSVPHVGGRSLGLAAMEAAFLAELETSPMQGAGVSSLLVAFRLGLLGLWLLMGLAILFVRPRALGRAADSLGSRLTTTTLLGLLAICSGMVLATLTFLWAPGQVSIVLIGLVAGMFLAAKAFGLAAICLFVGRLVSRGMKRGSLLFGDPAALAAGLLGLGALSLLPLAGPVIWGLVSILAIGVSVLALILPAESPRPI